MRRTKAFHCHSLANGAPERNLHRFHFELLLCLHHALTPINQKESPMGRRVMLVLVCVLTGLALGPTAAWATNITLFTSGTDAPPAGSATFKDLGEIVDVCDNKSDGRRVVVFHF